MKSAELVIICDTYASRTALESSRDWIAGVRSHPYYDHVGRLVVTDAATRSTNFPEALSPVLYSVGQASARSSPRPTRYHTVSPINVSVSEYLRTANQSGVEPSTLKIELLYAEALIFDSDDPCPSTVAVHARAKADDLDDIVSALNSLTRERGSRGQSTARGAAFHELLRGSAHFESGFVFPSDRSSSSEGNIYTMILSDAPGVSHVSYENTEKPTAADDTALYCYAAGHRTDANASSAQSEFDALKGVRRLSRSWSQLTLRHGTAFQFHTSFDDPFRLYAEIFFRTLYADTFMLALLQDRVVRDWESEAISTLASLTHSADLSDTSDRMRRLNRRMAVDGTRYWIKRSSANTGRSVRLLHDAQDALDLHIRLRAVEQQIATLTSIAESDAESRRTVSQERVTRAVETLGSVAVPIGICMGSFEILAVRPTFWSLTLLVIASALSSVAAWSLLKVASRDSKRGFGPPSVLKQ